MKRPIIECKILCTSISLFILVNCLVDIKVTLQTSTQLNVNAFKQSDLNVLDLRKKSPLFCGSSPHYSVSRFKRSSRNNLQQISSNRASNHRDVAPNKGQRHRLGLNRNGEFYEESNVEIDLSIEDARPEDAQCRDSTSKITSAATTLNQSRKGSGKTIETAVFIDQALDNKFAGISGGFVELNKQVLTIMNQVI